MYVNLREFNGGFVVARAFSPRSHVQKEREISGWLPEILICKAEKDAPVYVKGSSIVAKGPAKSYVVQFNPWFDKEKTHKIIYKFANSFVPDGENKKNINAVLHDTTGYFDNNSFRPGEISYSSIANRDIVLYGSEKELEDMISSTCINFPIQSYNLEYDEHTANGRSKYQINISEAERKEFVERLSKRLLTL
jgi:hypothetical protein